MQSFVCWDGRRTIHRTYHPPDVVSRGTENIIDAVKRHDSGRLVVGTSIGLGSSITNLPWYGRLANVTVLQSLMADDGTATAILVRFAGTQSSLFGQWEQTDQLFLRATVAF